MKKVKLLLAVIILSLIAFVVGWFKLFNIIQSPQENPPTEKVTTLTVDFGNDRKINFEEAFNNEGQTAYSILVDASQEQGFNLQTQEYDFGVFIKSIDGYESTAEKAWIYFVNSQGGTVAADKYQLNPGDNVEWKYLEPSAE